MAAVTDTGPPRLAVSASAPSAEPDVLRALRHVVARRRIPTARPPIERADEAVGLATLDLVLRLDHVSRVADSLRMIDKGHLRRSVGLDIDLRVLTPDQRRSLRVRPSDGGMSSPREPAHLWVPVSRHSRRDLAPVVVRDATGAVIPRLTRTAATRAIVAGMTRLFKMLAGSRRDVAAYEMRTQHRARWLIERSISDLIELGPPSAMAEPVPAMSDPWRQAADRYLRTMPADQAEAFERLLEVAMGEELVIVMLPSEESHAHVTFEAPLVRADEGGAALRRGWWPLNWADREYTVQYDTEIPRSLTSYHVIVDVPEEIYVRRFVLSSDADADAVAPLCDEMRQLSELPAQLPAHLQADTVAVDAVTRFEVPAVLTRLAELGLRRSRDAARYCRYLQDDPLRGDPESAPKPRSPVDDPLRALADGQCSVPVLEGLAQCEARDGLRRVLSEQPQLLEAVRRSLGRVADRLEASELASDVVVENDPRENGAHAQWAPRALPFGAPTLEPIKARVFLTMADERPALGDSVRQLIGSLLAIVLGILVVLLLRSTGPQDGVEADAVVAVLLIVPGVLLSRLDIPSTNSVLGQIRAGPRRVAYAAVTLTSGLAVVIAAWPDPGVDAAGAVVTAVLLLGLFALSYRDLRAREASRRLAVPVAARVPSWLREELDCPVDDRTAVTPDARFDTIDGSSVRSPSASTPTGRWRRRPGVPSEARRRRLSERDVRPLDQPALTSDAPSRARDGRRLRRGADLANAAARAVVEGRTALEFTVSHRTPSVVGAPGTDEGSPAAEPAPSPALAQESLWFSAFGSEVRVSNAPATVEAPELPEARFLGRLAVDGQEVTDFGGVAPIYPGSVGNASPTLEVLVSVDSFRHLAPLVASILRSGDTGDTGNGQPDRTPAIRSLHFPESPFEGSVRDDAFANARAVVAPCARLSFAITATGGGRHGAADQRLALIARLVAICRRAGATLCVADRDAAAGPYEWRQLDVPAMIRLPDDTAMQVPDRPRGHVLLTLAGRPGAHRTDDIARICELLHRGPHDVLAVSAAALHQQTYISMLLPSTLGAGTDRLSDDDAALAVRADVLPFHDLLGIDYVDNELQHALSRYQAMLSAVRTPPRHASADASGPWPLWVLWDAPVALPDGEPLDVLTIVIQQLSAPGREPALVHRRVRRRGDGRERGRAKLAVRLLPGDPPAAANAREPAEVQRLGRVAKRAQEQATAKVVHAGIDRHHLHLQVVSREWWLAERTYSRP